MNFVTIGWITGSISSSTFLIILNKSIMKNYDFRCTTFLTAYHFFMTYSLLELMCRLKLIDRTTNMPQSDRWFMTSFGVGAVVFMNMNLKFNSVGFYQLSKLCTIPFLVIYGLITEGKKTSVQTQISLAALMIGISLFSVNDIELNLVGTVIAIAGVTCVGIFQTKTGSKQKQYDVSGPSLQHATALPQFVMSLIASFILETRGSNSIFQHHFNNFELFLIIISGFIAVSVNVCLFGLIGKTSAVTFQVVGHAKTILIFVFGLAMFKNKEVTQAQFIKQIVGLVISMIGIISYSHFQLKEKEIESLSKPKLNLNRREIDESESDLKPNLFDIPFETFENTKK